MKRRIGDRLSTRAVALLLALASLGAHAATITVTTSADDLTPNDGSVSLREAMTAINAGNDLGDPDITAQSPGTFGTNDQIHFSIAGGGLHTVTLTAPLPLLVKAMAIDGYTQPGASANTLNVGDNAVLTIRVDQNGQGNVLFLSTGSDGTTIRGLAVVNTSGNVFDVRSSNNVIAGNFIGIDTNGISISGSGTAVTISNGITGNVVGGGTPADRNVMASSNGDVVDTVGDATILGNYINTVAAGNAAIGSVVNAIDVGGGNVIIGGTGVNDGNVIGQWNGGGIDVRVQNIFIPLNSVTILGNRIGVDVTGTFKLNGGQSGVSLSNGNPGYVAVIGGSAAGAGNIISGASVTGISMNGSNDGPVTIQGNKIGTDAAGVNAIQNLQSGICVGSGGSGQIGGVNPGEGNIIAYSGTNGVTIGGGISGWSIRGNSIFLNQGLGISLGGRCDLQAVPTANDAGDADTGPNNQQNFPVITQASVNGLLITIGGTLNSTPFTSFNIDFFSSASCDASGNGEGKTYLGSTTAVTNGAGDAVIAPLDYQNTPGEPIIAATATDPGHNTSEFSQCFNAGASLPTLSINNVSQNEGNSGTTAFTFTVTLSAASASTVTVDFATADGTATAPGDYAAASGTLTFNPGVTSRTVTVNVAGDTSVEPNETFAVNLSNAGNATIAAATGTGTIVNDDAAGLPSLSIDNVSQNEGNSGTSAYTFTVTLSAASASTVTVNFATADGTAVAGSDYTATSGTLTFNPGVTTQAITVNVLGDTTVEANETFRVDLSAPTNATIAAVQGTGSIVNDDGAGPATNVIIPTLDPRGLGLLVLLLAAAAGWALKRAARR
jgi:hypothetical protein